MSVIVMGYRNGATIERAVRSVVEQADADVEVVVATSGGDDSAARVAAAFPVVPVVESPTRLMPGGVRNAGLAVTTGPVVAFLEADCVAAPGWVARRRQLHDEGRPVVASAAGNLDRRNLAAWGFHVGLYANRLTGRPSGPITAGDGGAYGCSFHRTALDAIGGFDDRLRIGEDTVAVHRLQSLGLPIWYEGGVVTLHRAPRSVVALVRDRHARGRRRARMQGRVGDRWVDVATELVRNARDVVPRARRNAGADRVWVDACLPWFLAGQAAALVGWQREALRMERDGVAPTWARGLDRGDA